MKNTTTVKTMDTFTRRFEMKRLILTGFLMIIMAGVLISPAMARIKLVTLPDRDKMFIDLGHPNFMLVEEERIVTLQKGMNHIDFSWKAVSIDKDSIQFRALSDPDKISVLSVSYPPGENALVWDVDSIKAGAERIRISYLLYGIQREVSYRAVAAHDEKDMEFRSYIKLVNRSGEDLEDTRILSAFGANYEKDLESGEAKQMLSFKKEALPINKTYTFDPREGGDKVRMHYVINNEATSGLGEFALRDGKARIFQKDSQDTVIFVGEDWGKYTPVTEEMKLFLGVARDVVVKRSLMNRERINVRRNNGDHVVLFDSEELYKVEMENFKDEPVQLKVVEHINDTWEIPESSHKWTRKDADTAEFLIDLPPKGEKVTLEFQVVRRNLQNDNEPPAPIVPGTMGKPRFNR
jgi:hypothetical protein